MCFYSSKFVRSIWVEVGLIKGLISAFLPAVIDKISPKNHCQEIQF